MVAGAVDTALICTLEGTEPDRVPVEFAFRVETLGTVLNDLAARGVSEVCFCGAVARPALDPALIDAATMPLVPVFMQALGQGDDGALRAVVSIFEDKGFTVRGAHDIAPELLPRPGVLTRTQPGAGAEADVAVALQVLEEMGQQDLGQACVIREGIVIAREVESGTDAMLASVALSMPEGAEAVDPDGGASGTVLDQISAARTHNAPNSGLLFKAPKPGQDRRIDLPTIGPATAMGAARAGLDGIVIEAGGVMVLNLPQVIEILDMMGMYLWVRP